MAWRWLHEFLEEKGVTLDDNFKLPPKNRQHLTKRKKDNHPKSRLAKHKSAGIEISENGFIVCALCGGDTHYTKLDDPGAQCHFKEGLGQLCFKCGTDDDGAC